jgi:hypothetical protein
MREPRWRRHSFRVGSRMRELATPLGAGATEQPLGIAWVPNSASGAFTASRLTLCAGFRVPVDGGHPV